MPAFELASICICIKNTGECLKIISDDISVDKNSKK